MWNFIFLSKLPIHSIIVEISLVSTIYHSFPGGTVVKNDANARNTGDAGLILGQGDTSSRKWNLLQYSWVENSATETLEATAQGLQRVGHNRATEHTHMYAIWCDLGDAIMNNTCLQTVIMISLVGQWLKGDSGFIPGWETKIPYAL